MKWLTSYSKKREAAKGFSNPQSQQTAQTFILEPILTPSGILDGGDDTPDPLTLDWETNDLPDVDTVDSDSNVDIDNVVEGEVSETNTDLDTEINQDEVAINLLDTEISEQDLETVDFIEKLDIPEVDGDESPALESTESEFLQVNYPEKAADSDTQLTGTSNQEISPEIKSTEVELTNTSVRTIDAANDTDLQLITGSETDSNEDLSISDFANGVDELDTTLAGGEAEETTDFVVEGFGVDDISFSDPYFDYDSGVFTVGETGEVDIDFLFDGGGYKGELAIFSLDGMDEFEPGSQEFIKEAASRALSGSDLGHIVIADATEGAKFSGNLGETNQNSGAYLGVKTFSMRPGDTFAVMLVPNGKVEQVFNNPDIGGAVRPLFSLVTSNPNDAFHVGQIADVTGDGNTFVMEDMRVDTGSDRDYNDIIFQVRGATGKAALMDDVVASGKDWRTSDLGRALIAYAEPYIEPEIVDELELIDEEIPIDDELILPDEVVKNSFNESLPANDNQEVSDEPTNEKFVVDKQDVSDEKVEELRADSEIDEKQIVSSSPAEDVVSNGLEDDRILEPVSPASANNENDTVDSLAENDQAIEVADSQITTEAIDVEDTVTKDKIEEVVSREENAIASPTITTTQTKTEVTEIKPAITVNNSSPTVVEEVAVENVSTSAPTPVVAETKNVDSVGELKADSSIVKTVEIGNGGTQTNVINSDVVGAENQIASNANIAPETSTKIIDTPATFTPVKAPIQYEFSQENQPLIGVIDTGFAANNPDIDYSRITLGTDLVANDDNPLLSAGEGSEHGTHVLGIIAAQQNNNIGIDGINDDAPLWVGRAIGSGKWAESLVEFVDAAKQSGQPNAVVNLSLDLTQINPDGSVTTRYEFTPAERAAIEYARQHNVLIVVAAGNDGGVMSALGQSSQEFDNIITVGAAERVNNSVAISKAYDRADYSSYGYGLDIMADGGSVNNPVLSTTGDGVGTMAGTSVASAKVTGAVSQVWAANPNLSYRQVIEILKNTATDLKTPGWDAQTGAGFLNMTAAVLLAKVTTPEVYDPKDISSPTTWGGEGKVTALERAVNNNFVYLSTNLGQILQIDTNTGEQRQIYQGLTFTDLALAANGYLYASTFDSLYQIDPNNGQTINVGSFNNGARINSLAFSPSGKLYGADEKNGSVYEISLNNAQVNVIGNLGAPSSGDMVFNGDNEIIATTGSRSIPRDSLVAFNLVNRSSRLITTFNDSEFYGLTLINGQLMAYNSGGQKVEIDLNTGATNFTGFFNLDGQIWGATNGINGGSNNNASADWQNAIENEYQQTQGLLGSPTGPIAGAGNSPQGTSGLWQSYSTGTIHWTAKYGAVAVWHDLQREYNDVGGSSGWLGFPTRREYEWNGGKRTDFEGGYIYWDGQRAKAYRLGEMPQPSLPANNSVVINGYTISGDFYNVYQRNQGIGNPIEDVQRFSDTVTYQRFQNGSIVSSPKGTFPLYGGIRQEYLRNGGLNGDLGAPITEELDRGGTNKIQYFENGHIYWNGSQAIAYRTGQAGSSSPPNSTPNQTSDPNGFNPIEFRLRIGVTPGIKLRTDTYLNAPSEGVTNQTEFLFDGWKYGEPVQDRTIANGQMDSLWFRVKGTNYWIPSAFMIGYPPGYQPPASSGASNSNNGSSGSGYGGGTSTGTIRTGGNSGIKGELEAIKQQIERLRSVIKKQETIIREKEQAMEAIKKENDYLIIPKIKEKQNRLEEIKKNPLWQFWFTSRNEVSTLENDLVYLNGQNRINDELSKRLNQEKQEAEQKKNAFIGQIQTEELELRTLEEKYKHYILLSNLNDERWDWVAGENTRVTGVFVPEVESDERGYPEYEAVLALYRDLEESLLGSRNIKMSVGYVQDKNYVNSLGRYHGGIDIAASTDKKVKNNVKGIVRLAQRNPDGTVYGDGIVAIESNGKIYLYVHLDKIYVTKDDELKDFVDIGEVGGTGDGNPNKWGPHLHYEVAGKDYLYGSTLSNKQMVIDRTFNPLKDYWEMMWFGQ